jgi:hypothetical protein
MDMDSGAKSEGNARKKAVMARTCEDTPKLIKDILANWFYNGAIGKGKILE